MAESDTSGFCLCKHKEAWSRRRTRGIVERLYFCSSNVHCGFEVKEPLLLYCVFSALCSSKILGCDKKTFFRNTYKFLQFCEIKTGLWKKGGRGKTSPHITRQATMKPCWPQNTLLACVCVRGCGDLKFLACVFYIVSVQIPWRALTPFVFTLCSYPQIKTSSLRWQRFSNRANLKVATVSSKKEYSL